MENQLIDFYPTKAHFCFTFSTCEGKTCENIGFQMPIQ